MRNLINDERAVNIQLGFLINLLTLMFLAIAIGGTFYLRAEDSAQQAARAGFIDLGNQVSRHITNSYILSAQSNNNLSVHIRQDIPLKIGGKNYKIELKNASEKADRIASVDITELGHAGQTETTKLNDVDASVNLTGSAYSGSGEIDIHMERNQSGVWIWIE